MLKGTIKLSSITSTGSAQSQSRPVLQQRRSEFRLRFACCARKDPPHRRDHKPFALPSQTSVNVESAVVFSDDLGGKFPYNGRWSCGISKSREGTWPGPAAALAVRSSYRSQPQSQLHNMMSRFLQYSLDYRYRVHNQALVSSAGTRIFVRLDFS